MGDGAGSIGMNLMSALTWALDSMLLVDLAFRVLVMLRGRSPNLQDKTKACQWHEQEAGGQ